MVSSNVHMSQDEDNVWIDQVIKGQAQAFGRLVDKYESYVYTIAFRILHNRNDAEDAAMEVFVKAYQNLGKFNRRSVFSTWLYRIAYNASISAFRARSKRKNEVADDALLAKMAAYAVDESGDETESDEHRLIVSMRYLTAEENALLTLFYTNDLSVEQISGIVGISVSNVKVRLFRTRKKLEVLMQQQKNVELSTSK